MGAEIKYWVLITVADSAPVPTGTIITNITEVSEGSEGQIWFSFNYGGSKVMYACTNDAEALAAWTIL